MELVRKTQLHLPLLLTHITTDQTASLASDLSGIPTSLISELNSQLENWLQCIPTTLSASLLSTLTLSHTDPLFYQSYPNNLLGQIKGRYWAARFVIHRPFVYKALHSPTESLTEEDLKGVEECLIAGLNTPLQMGIMSEKPWLIASPFGPIRRYATSSSYFFPPLATIHSRSKFPY